MSLSFVIPVYNVEKYLVKCLDSILVGNQFTGQVICVNDGSTDESGKILEQYALKYTNVEIITQSNAGLSAARNAGIKAAKGEYVCFLDSDDYWHPNVLDGLLEQVERDNLDVLRFRFQNVNEQYEVFNPYKHNHTKDNDYSKEVTDGVTFLNERMGTQCYAAMFIIKRSLLVDDRCFFTEGIYFEDTEWMPRMLIKAKRVASSNTIVYNYLMREGSITNAIERNKQKKILDDKMQLIQNLQEQGTQLRQSGKERTWFDKMITDNVVSIIGILSTQFYQERLTYLNRLRDMEVYPIQSRSGKARLINLSPRIAVGLLHIKNG
jgi:Glycosyltransferases involved in cell wall biogenesis